MMGRQSRQTAMIFVDIESLIPETHLLRKIERMVSFDFIYDLLAPYYPATGRPSVDPVSMFKMLLIGYLYGIKSERRLVEEVQLNFRYNHRFPNRAEATVELIRLGLEEVARREQCVHEAYSTISYHGREVEYAQSGDASGIYNRAVRR